MSEEQKNPAEAAATEEVKEASQPEAGTSPATFDVGPEKVVVNVPRPADENGNPKALTTEEEEQIKLLFKTTSMAVAKTLGKVIETYVNGMKEIHPSMHGVIAAGIMHGLLVGTNLTNEFFGFTDDEFRKMVEDSIEKGAVN